MKPRAANSAVLTARCAHRSPAGRQCRLVASDARSGLCPQHRAEQKQVEAADHYLHLIRNFQCFQTAQGINHSLHNLYELLAQNRISPRRAAVLSYISSLLLRTLPQIDADKAAGIIDPSKPVPLNVAVLDEDSDDEEEEEDDSDLDPEPDDDANTDSETEIEPETETATETDTQFDSTAAWDASIPEPDPTKKPS